MDITPHHSHPIQARRTRRALGPIVLGVGLLTTALSGSAASAQTSSFTRQPLVARGEGQVTGELPFCLDGSAGPCGWVVEGTTAGTPITSGSFFAVIDHGNGATPDRCVPATYSGVLSAGPDDTIAQAATGRVCPDSAGGFRFTGRLDGTAGTGRFGEVSDSRGIVHTTMAADGDARLSVAGHLRIG